MRGGFCVSCEKRDDFLEKGRRGRRQRRNPLRLGSQCTGLAATLNSVSPVTVWGGLWGLISWPRRQGKCHQWEEGHGRPLQHHRAGLRLGRWPRQRVAVATSSLLSLSEQEILKPGLAAGSWWGAA